jgi:hypothetical protein
MTTCKRYFRNCNDFGICVNIGKKGYVLAEEPTERKTIFQYGIYGVGKFARIFDPNYIVFEGGKFYDVREYEKDNVVFEAQEDFFLIGFNKLDDYNWEGRLIDKDEDKLDLKSIYDQEIPVNHRCFIICFDGNPQVNGKKLKRYDYAEVTYPKEYNINLNGGVLGFFKKLC